MERLVLCGQKKDRLEACCTYAAVGNLTEVSNKSSIPYATLKKWKQEDWWKETSEHIISEGESVLDKKLSAIIDRTMESIEDRLER